MLFSTPQMSSYHSLAERPIHLSLGDKPLERVHSIKVLGVHMTDTLKWDDHIKHLASSCYGVLAALRKIKNFTNYHLRKHLVECLVLSRLDFSDIIFYPITDCIVRGHVSEKSFSWAFYEHFSFFTETYSLNGIGGFHAISGDKNNNGEMNKCWWTSKAR